VRRSSGRVEAILLGLRRRSSWGLRLRDGRVLLETCKESRLEVEAGAVRRAGIGCMDGRPVLRRGGTGAAMTTALGRSLICEYPQFYVSTLDVRDLRCKAT
jgi:hypothetical protein